MCNLLKSFEVFFGEHPALPIAGEGWVTLEEDGLDSAIPEGEEAESDEVIEFEEAVKILGRMLEPQEELVMYAYEVLSSLGVPTTTITKRTEEWLRKAGFLMKGTPLDVQLCVSVVFFFLTLGAASYCIPWWGRAVLGAMIYVKVNPIWGMIMVATSLFYVVRKLFASEKTNERIRDTSRRMEGIWALPGLVISVAILLNVAEVIDGRMLIAVTGCMGVVALSTLIPMVSLHAQQSTMLAMINWLVIAIGVLVFSYFVTGLTPESFEWLQPFWQWTKTGYTGRWETIRDKVRRESEDSWTQARTEEAYGSPGIDYLSQIRKWGVFIGDFTIGQKMLVLVSSSVARVVFKFCATAFMLFAGMHDGMSVEAQRAGEMDATFALGTRGDRPELRDQLRPAIVKRLTNIWVNNKKILGAILAQGLYDCWTSGLVETAAILVGSYFFAVTLIEGIYHVPGVSMIAALRSVNAKVTVNHTPEISSRVNVTCILTMFQMWMVGCYLLCATNYSWLTYWAIPLSAAYAMLRSVTDVEEMEQLWMLTAYCVLTRDILTGSLCGHTWYLWWKGTNPRNWKILFRYQTTPVALVVLGDVP